MFSSWTKPEPKEPVVNLDNLQRFYNNAINTNVSLKRGDLVYVDGKYLAYVYSVSPLSEDYEKLGYARNVVVFCTKNNNICVEEVDSRVCRVINGCGTDKPDEIRLLNFVSDHEHNEFKAGQFVRSKNGVELFFGSGEYKFSSEVKNKLLSPLIITSLKCPKSFFSKDNTDYVTVAGTLSDGKIVEVNVHKFLLHSTNVVNYDKN